MAEAVTVHSVQKDISTPKGNSISCTVTLEQVRVVATCGTHFQIRTAEDKVV